MDNIDTRPNIQNIFNDIRDSITMHNYIDLEIRNIASNMFEYINSCNSIKRARPRKGLVLACLYLAGLHVNYPISVDEISRISGIESSYISSELKSLNPLIKELGYDIRVTDHKYINRYIMDLQEYNKKYSLGISSLDLARIKDKLIYAIDTMNEDDILIKYNVNTRIYCVMYLIMKKIGIDITNKTMIQLFKISKNTFQSFIRRLEPYHGLIFKN